MLPFALARACLRLPASEGVPMRWTLVIAAVVIAAVSVACSDNTTPATPTPTPAPTPTPTPTPATVTLSGTVRNQAGTALAGAVVAVLDGVNKNIAALTDTAGLYTLKSLAPGGMTISANATGYEESKTGVNVTGTNSLN